MPAPFENHITLDLGEDGSTPSLVVNGVELVHQITPDWSLRNVTEDGLRTVYLTVTFPVIMP